MDTKSVFTKDTGAKFTPRVQSIRISDLPAAASDYNAEVFGDFLRDMKGTKSSREFACETEAVRCIRCGSAGALPATIPSLYQAGAGGG